jgi:hypothetical protein
VVDSRLTKRERLGAWGSKRQKRPITYRKQSASGSPPKASRWREFISAGSTILAVTAGVLGATVAFWVVFNAFNTERFLSEQVKITTIPELSQSDIAVLKARIDDNQKTLSTLNAQIQHSIANIPPQSALNLQLQQLSTSVGDINDRLTKLESVILNNPVEALEIPLMQRDIDNIKASEKDGFKSVKESIDRIYDISKWLLGAMAISIISLAVGNLLKSKEVPSSPSFID